MKSTTPLQVHLEGVGFYGPGLSGWPQTAEVLAGRAALTLAPLQLPPAEALPAAERRRAGTAIKLAFATGFEAIRQAGADPATLRTVFASSAADCDNCNTILETLASSDRAVSPTRFHNSVHNAPSGYWSIATACRAPSTSLCAYDGSFAAGLLEAATQVLSSGESCLLLAYDTPYPQPLASLRPITHPLGLALLLSPRPGPATLAALGLGLTRQAASRMSDPALELLRRDTPAARSLPLLQRLARAEGGRVRLDYLDGMSLDAEIQPAA
ncbi:MAG: beta-ketoacyl synthase chain length factor [Burkholderiales bacterium]|nr:beta-ketoacyl synthase chain length factor [Burkholderiales bacterium]